MRHGVLPNKQTRVCRQDRQPGLFLCVARVTRREKRGTFTFRKRFARHRRRYMLSRRRGDAGSANMSRDVVSRTWMPIVRFAAVSVLCGLTIGDALAQRPPYRERPDAYERDDDRGR